MKTKGERMEYICEI